MTSQIDLCIALKEYYKKPSEFLPIINELYTETKDETFVEWIKGYCLENNICPKCYMYLEIKTKEENHTEVDYFNTEYIYYGMCNACGWNEEK